MWTAWRRGKWPRLWLSPPEARRRTWLAAWRRTAASTLTQCLRSGLRTLPTASFIVPHETSNGEPPDLISCKTGWKKH